ncbi:MAG TPA: hypothetical protein PKY40_15675, partial [Burkholderiaceae bacterium]|nr:hypothetical protein [Burkholderiaceae bacterium]
ETAALRDFTEGAYQFEGVHCFRCGNAVVRLCLVLKGRAGPICFSQASSPASLRGKGTGAFHR